jgi:hypothetical protein
MEPAQITHSQIQYNNIFLSAENVQAELKTIDPTFLLKLEMNTANMVVTSPPFRRMLSKSFQQFSSQ